MHDELPVTRRQALCYGTALLAAAVPGPAWAYALDAPARAALAESPLVYISPLKAGGEESACHGEVWFFADGDDVIIGTQTSTWKVRALQRGYNRARVWIADYGPEWRSFGRYRSAPNFLAEVLQDKNQATYDQLMQAFARRYPDEWGAWRDKFRQQYADGSRVLLRYRPIAA